MPDFGAPVTKGSVQIAGEQPWSRVRPSSLEKIGAEEEAAARGNSKHPSAAPVCLVPTGSQAVQRDTAEGSLQRNICLASEILGEKKKPSYWFLAHKEFYDWTLKLSLNGDSLFSPPH